MNDRFANVSAELQNKYNTDFLKNIFSIDRAEVYLFGGALRDIAFGKDWKEADIRVVLPLPLLERQLVMEKALESVKIDEKVVLEAIDLVIYRFLPEGSNTKSAVDLSVSSTMEGALPDFTINSLFYNLKTNKLIDRFSAMQDIENKILRTCYDPEKQFAERPDTIFRAIKAAVSNDLTIENKTLEALKNSAPNIEKVLGFVRDNKRGLMLELTQSDMFRGLKYNPYNYVQLFNDLGLLDVFVDFIQKELSIQIDEIQNPFEVGKTYDFEEAISIFISAISNKTNDPNLSFDKMTDLFSLKRIPEYTDFVIDPNKIKYYA
jgi:tRNA nucleotidyltransferase/poly(A) polymerase